MNIIFDKHVNIIQNKIYTGFGDENQLKSKCIGEKKISILHNV